MTRYSEPAQKLKLHRRNCNNSIIDFLPNLAEVT